MKKASGKNNKKIDEKKGGPRVTFQDKSEEHQITVPMKGVIDA